MSSELPDSIICYKVFTNKHLWNMLPLADFFLSVGLGLGGTDTPQVTQRKSMSYERTFSPTEDEALLHQKLGTDKRMLIQFSCYLCISYSTKAIEIYNPACGDKSRGVQRCLCSNNIVSSWILSHQILWL